MNPKVLNGRKPLSQKSRPAAMKAMTDEIFGTAFHLPPAIAEELEKKGLVGRFVNAKVLYANQGHHPRGWVPYKPEKPVTIEGVEFKTGSDPEGWVRRGDCILAVKTMANHQKHRNVLDEKASIYKGYSKQKQTELQEQARAAGADVHVDEGFDGEDDDND